MSSSESQIDTDIKTEIFTRHKELIMNGSLEKAHFIYYTMQCAIIEFDTLVTRKIMQNGELINLYREHQHHQEQILLELKNDKVVQQLFLELKK
jgi:hypothetical protein